MKSEILRARLLSNLNAAMEEEARKINLEEANKIKAVMGDAKKYEAPKLGGLMEQGGKTKAPKVRISKTAVKFEGHRYALINKPMTWHVARDYSESLGGQLVRINSKEEFFFLKNTFLSQLNSKGAAFSIDGSDEIEEGVWLYSDGKKVDFSVMKYQLRNDEEYQYLSFSTDQGGIVLDGDNDRCRFVIEWDK
jgi:hypothetical protein